MKVRTVREFSQPPGPSAFVVQPSFTASLSALPALNDGAFEAEIETLSPVGGFRPVPALQLLVAPFPRITPTGQSQHLTRTRSLAAAYPPEPRAVPE